MTVLLLVVLGTHQWSRSPQPEPVVDGESYIHLAGDLPTVIGPWVGQRWQPPVLGRSVKGLSRQGRVFEHLDTGRRVAVLIVQGPDRRSTGHYSPAQWYAARGWSVLARRRVHLSIADRRVPAEEHDLAGLEADSPLSEGVEPASGRVETQLTVLSFAVLPGGVIAPGLDEAGLGAVSPQHRDGGAALVQLVFPGDTPRRERELATNRLMRTLILSIREQRSGAGDQP